MACSLPPGKKSSPWNVCPSGSYNHCWAVAFHLFKSGWAQLGNMPFSGRSAISGGKKMLLKRPQREFQKRLAITHLMLTPSHILINNCSKVQLLSSVPTPDQHSLILHPLVWTDGFFSLLGEIGAFLIPSLQVFLFPSSRWISPVLHFSSYPFIWEEATW